MRKKKIQYIINDDEEVVKKQDTIQPNTTDVHPSKLKGFTFPNSPR